MTRGPYRLTPSGFSGYDNDTKRGPGLRPSGHANRAKPPDHPAQ